MNLQYKGVNERGRVEWVELDLADSLNPEGVVMEEWVLLRYRPFVEEIQTVIGRHLNKDELRTILWLSGFDQSTIKHIRGIIRAGYEHGERCK